MDKPSKTSSAAAMAKKLKEEEDTQKERDKKASEIQAADRERTRKKLTGWITKALSSFGDKFVVEKMWFAGSDYWVLKKWGKALLSCVLSYESGTWNPSDDCRGVPYEGWEILVCPGQWSGPHGRSGRGGITSQEALNEYIAQIMKDHI